MRPNDLSIGRKIFAIAALANVCLTLFWFGYDGVDAFVLGITYGGLFAVKAQFHLALRVIA